jgi:aspartyl-tRNA(Asn)/glutamyl-tRNA(Gln) amidotransferase subunit B
VDPKAAANWVTGSWLALQKTDPEAAARVDAIQLADLIERVACGDLSRTNAKEVFAEHAASGESVASIVESKGYLQISDEDTLAGIVGEIIDANPKAVEDYRAGKPVVGFFVGQVMKATRGQANAALVQEAVVAKLDGGSG